MKSAHPALKLSALASASATSSLALSYGERSSMVKTPKKDGSGDERPPDETERIAAKTLKNLLNTPPKPFTKKAKGKDAKAKG